MATVGVVFSYMNDVGTWIVYRGAEMMVDVVLQMAKRASTSAL